MADTEEFCCERCNAEVDYDDTIEIGGEDVCPACFDSAAVCCVCAEKTMDPQIGPNDLNYCAVCYDETIRPCANCGTDVAEDDEIPVGNEMWCENCADNSATDCNECGTRYPTDDMVSVGWDGYEKICQECYENEYFTCEGCDCVYHSDDAYHTDYSSYCQECYEEHVTSHLIHDYGFKPSPHYFKLRPHESKHRINRLYFGVETEVEACGRYTCNDLADWISCEDNIELFYYKWDSSLSDGFEIVSHPFTWQWMLKNKERFEPMLALRTRGALSYNTSTCGMHVHMSRRAFSHLQILKFLTLFYDYPMFTRTISRRNESSLNSYANLTKDKDPIAVARNGRNSWGRGALNFQNGSTIECRIFRGTLNPTGWFSNIEFLHSAFEFCEAYGLPDINPTNYLNWVADRPKIYPNFMRVHMPRLSPDVTERIA